MVKYYLFKQNNSGGRFIEDYMVAPFVAIEANSASLANTLAEKNGIYFDGVKNGIDCPCCGDRWLKINIEGRDGFLMLLIL